MEAFDIFPCCMMEVFMLFLLPALSYTIHTSTQQRINTDQQELLGKHIFNTEDSKTVRVELEKYFDSTKKEI